MKLLAIGGSVRLNRGRENGSWKSPGCCFDFPPSGGPFSQTGSRQRLRDFNARTAVYVKVFTQIFDSSIANDYELRHFFMDLLILAESDGVVDMTPEAISGRTRIPLDDVNKYLAELEKPDPRSRTHTEDGRRIMRIDPLRDWGWKITNYQMYRSVRDEAERKEYMRNYMRKRRQSPKEPHVNPVNIGKLPLAHAEAEAEAEAEVQTLSGKPDGGEALRAPKEKTYHKDARSVLHLLNETCGRQFREVDANLSVISQRLREPGVTFDGVSMMIARQCQRWMNTTQAEYLRPETLFGKTKFDSYYAAREQPVILSDNPKTAAAQQAKLEFVRAMLK